MANGRSTYQTYLMIGTTTGEGASAVTTYSKLIDIVSFPDMMPEPETIDTTSLSDGRYTSIPGIQGGDGNMTFEANYTKDNFTTINNVDKETIQDLAVYFGANASGTPDGHDGIFKFKGYVRPTVQGGGVNEKIGMNVVVTPTEDVKYSVPAGG